MVTEWLVPLRGARAHSISEETLFHVLRNKRRRYALHYLKQREETTPVSELAEQIAAWENDTAVLDVTPPERKRVYISLIQTHLPTMEESDMVRVSDENTDVELTEGAKEIDIYVELVPERDIRWSEYYLSLSAFTGAFVLAAYVGVYPLTELPPVVWLAFVSLLFVASTAIHFVYRRRNRLGTEGAPPE